MTGRRTRRLRPPLNEERLKELALAYVARFATSRAKLAAYLARKLRERGWEESGEPPIEALVAKAADAGFVDDAAFALSKSRSLTDRGYGSRRVRQALQAAGIREADGKTALTHAQESSLDAALRLAKRRRFGPYGERVADRETREKQLAAMVRAGHDYRLSKVIIALEPGTAIDPQALEEHR